MLLCIIIKTIIIKKKKEKEKRKKQTQKKINNIILKYELLEFFIMNILAQFVLIENKTLFYSLFFFSSRRSSVTSKVKISVSN